MLLHACVAVVSEAARRRVLPLVRATGVRTTTVSDPDRLSSRLSADVFDLVVAAADFLPEPVAQSIAAIRNLPDRPEVVVVLENKDMGRRSAFLAGGAMSVIDLGSSDGPLGELLMNVVGRCREAAGGRLRIEQSEESFRLADFASSSPAMRRLISTAKRVAVSDASLLILGETGVGKEWLARAIHEDGPRRQGPFLAVNMGAIPESLLESELFGHEKGSFTDAHRSHRGYFELAHGGTVFLDEVGELPGHLQSKLLRVLQEKKVRPLGGERSRPVDVRVIAATSRDMDREIEAERFRLDLYYRLGVVTLDIPALRERREDIPELVQSYFEHFQVLLRRRLNPIDPGIMETFVGYSWPGNVRELMNVIERAVLLCRGDTIRSQDLPDALVINRRSPAGEAVSPRPERVPGEQGLAGDDAGWWKRPLNAVLDDVMRPVERDYLERLLTTTGGRIEASARRAGISSRTFYEKMKKHGLRKEDYKP